MHMPEALPKRDFTNVQRNMVIIMCTAVCDVKSESEMNVVIRINACIKFLLALILVHSTIVIISGVSLAILVMVPVEVVFWGA